MRHATHTDTWAVIWTITCACALGCALALCAPAALAQSVESDSTLDSTSDTGQQMSIENGASSTGVADENPSDTSAGPAPVAETADTVTASAARLQLDTTQVTGNRELPKVLVIVPWKSPELVELTGRPLASLVEEVLSPIDPDVFRRQVDYYNALNDDSDGADNAPSK